MGQQDEPGHVIYRAGGDKGEVSVREEVGDKIVITGFVFDKISDLGQDHLSGRLTALLEASKNTTHARAVVADVNEKELFGPIIGAN